MINAKPLRQAALVCCVVGLFCTGLSASNTAYARMLGAIEFESCILTSAGLPRPTEAQCATIPVPENPAAPEGRTIDLALAWIPADAEPEPDPVFLIAGGPGQSARESYPAVSSAFRDIARSRHVLLLDQRGTGGSNPLVCPELDADDEAMDITDLSLQEIQDYAAACRDELAEKADLRFYTTAEAVFDLDFVRQAIGAEQVNLVGVSYGTRVAQQYAKAHPEHVRTLVLDGVVPATLVLGGEHAANLEAMLERHFERCRETPACAEALGDPREKLAKVAARLRAGGLEPVRYRDPTSGEWREEAPVYEHLSAVLRMYAYSPLTAAALPLVLDQAEAGDYAALLAMADMMMNQLGGQIASGMHNSVICTEDADELAALADDAAAGTVLGDEFADLLLTQCEIWPRGTLPVDFRSPLTGDIPVLAISGEYDPVTPPRYGEEVVASLPRGRHLVLTGQGHSIMGIGCMPKLAAQFIETADAAELDAACLERLAAPPPFSGLHGWEP